MLHDAAVILHGGHACEAVSCDEAVDCGDAEGQGLSTVLFTPCGLVRIIFNLSICSVGSQLLIMFTKGKAGKQKHGSHSLYESSWGHSGKHGKGSWKGHATRYWHSSGWL